jgi:hypothetical protein
MGRAAAALLVAVMVAAVSAEGRVKPLTAQDYAEIQQLYSKYHWVLGTGEPWASLFTPDGEYSQVGGPSKAKGREALAALDHKAFDGRPKGLRFVTNLRIEATPEGARGGCFMISMMFGEGGKPSNIGAAVYEDVLVKTSEGWRFKSRKTYLGEAAGTAPEVILQHEAEQRTESARK